MGRYIRGFDMANYFETLNAINVSDKVEKKNGLSYLSWSWAWGELKKRFPESTYTVYEDERNGWNYHTDGRTAWVKTGVTVNGIEHIEYLPVMDHRNNSIPLEKITSFDVNKAIQRSLTKAVARHGLGLYIYAGEDLPEGTEGTTEPKKAAPKKATPKAQPKNDGPLTEEELLFLAQRYKGDNLTKLLDYYNIEDISQIPAEAGRNLIQMIKAKSGGN